MFPSPFIKEQYPLQRPTKMRTEGDKRRFRALVTYVLANAVHQGHTLLHFQGVIDAINELPLAHRTHFTVEKIAGVTDFLREGDLYIDETNDYMKLAQYESCKAIVRRITASRLPQTMPTTKNWQQVIDNSFGPLQEDNEENDRKARGE